MLGSPSSPRALGPTRAVVSMGRAASVSAVYRVRVAYGQPTDPAAFDAYYVATHVPLVRQIPGLREFYAGHGDSPDGNSPAAYFQAELVFDSGTDAQAGLDSTQGQAAVADVPNFASGGATLSFVADEIVYRS